jgi:hypothetical protein
MFRHSSSAADTRFRKLSAWRAVRALRDDPEDTRQIFVIFRALRGKSVRALRRQRQAPMAGGFWRSADRCSRC